MKGPKEMEITDCNPEFGVGNEGLLGIWCGATYTNIQISPSRTHRACYGHTRSDYVVALSAKDERRLLGWLVRRVIARSINGIAELQRRKESRDAKP